MSHTMLSFDKDQCQLRTPYEYFRIDAEAQRHVTQGCVERTDRGTGGPLPNGVKLHKKGDDFPMTENGSAER